jgi:hypothetical protein
MAFCLAAVLLTVLAPYLIALLVVLRADMQRLSRRANM